MYMSGGNQQESDGRLKLYVYGESRQGTTS